MKAKDVMQRHVVTVTQTMTLDEVARLFIERHITGAPVINAPQNLIGVISQTDLVRHERGLSSDKVSRFQRELNGFLPRDLGLKILDNTHVEDVMTPWAVSFEENTPVQEIAKQMMLKRIHRVMITRKGKLVGIITSMDLVRVLVEAFKRLDKLDAGYE